MLKVKGWWISIKYFVRRIFNIHWNVEHLAKAFNCVRIYAGLINCLQRAAVEQMKEVKWNTKWRHADTKHETTFAFKPQIQFSANYASSTSSSKYELSNKDRALLPYSNCSFWLRRENKGKIFPKGFIEHVNSSFGMKDDTWECD